MSDVESTKKVRAQVAEPERRVFLKYSCKMAGALSLVPWVSGCGGGDGSASKSRAISYPIAAKVATTHDRTIVFGRPTGLIEPKYLSHIGEYDAQGYGTWTFGAPLAVEQRADLMPLGHAPTAGRTVNLLRFCAVSDIHVTDKESPAQLIYLQQLNQYGVEAKKTSVYSPNMLYTTQAFDAAVQTVNALHRETPLDFCISLGDVANSALYNETRWYIDILDGALIEPSSGEHAGADTIDYQRPFQAAGLDPSIPWYQTIGNHDHLWMGSIPPDGGGLGLRESCISNQVLAFGNALAHGQNIYNVDPPRFYMGVIDGSTPYGNIVKSGSVDAIGAAPQVVADPNRRLLKRTEWIGEFFKTTTQPVGHGFNLVPTGQEEGFACYSFVHKSDVPLKVIVLDDTQREDSGSYSIHGQGYLDAARWAWLKQELAAGDAAGQLMIIAAHIPIAVQKRGSCAEWYDKSVNPKDVDAKANAVDLQGLLDELHSHPNLLAWISGHRHLNAVKAFVSDDPARPERGFWQVETSSLLNFPQQLRLFEVNLNADYSVSMKTVNVDPAVADGTPAAVSRKYIVATQQIVNSTTALMADTACNYLVDPVTQKSLGIMDSSIRPMPTGAYNAELIVPLSAAMQARLRQLFPRV